MTRWHHRPTHRFVPECMYMVTAGTWHKLPFFQGDDRLRYLHEALLGITAEFGWSLESWAVLTNHYHFVGRSPGNPETLPRMIQKLHSVSAIAVNRLDGTPGRQVWFQYWDTCLSFENSYYARLNYVHHNAVHHRLVGEASLYPYCSAAWFERHAGPEFRKKVYSFGCERVNVVDDFD